MTCAICRFYDVCLVHNTIEACTHDGEDGKRTWIFGFEI